MITFLRDAGRLRPGLSHKTARDISGCYWRGRVPDVGARAWVVSQKYKTGWPASRALFADSAKTESRSNLAASVIFLGHFEVSPTLSL